MSEIDQITSLSTHEIMRASFNMAQFLVWAEADSGVTPEKLKEIRGSFVFVCELDSHITGSEFEDVMMTDLTMAGLSDDTAKVMTERLASRQARDEAARGGFIQEHQLAFGFCKNKKKTDVNEKKFVKKINQLAKN